MIRECCKIVGVKNSIEISTLADIPSQGSGLGSSSAVTVGLLNALFTYKGIAVSQKDLAEIACKIEIEILKNLIGKQDQYITAYGGFKKFTFRKNEDVTIRNFDFGTEELLKIGSDLILHYTNQTRKASEILSNQNNNIPNKIEELKSISALVDNLSFALWKGEYNVIGDLLRKNWELKKSLSQGITSDSIDKMVSTAMNNGASGCKISGAGGGGFLLAYVERNKQNHYRLAMYEYQELPFMIDKFGSRIIFNIP